MAVLHDEHPHYGWVTNKGYGTEEHLIALNRHGPTRHHRRSFAPVYRLLYPDAAPEVLSNLVQVEATATAAE